MNKRRNRNVLTIKLNIKTELIDNLVYYDLFITHDKTRLSDPLKIWNKCLRDNTFSKVEKEEKSIIQSDLFEIYKMLLIERKKKIRTPYINLEFVRDYNGWVKLKKYNLKHAIFILKALINYNEIALKNTEFFYNPFINLKLRTKENNEFVLTKNRTLKLKFPNSNILLTFFEYHLRKFDYFRSTMVFMEYDRPTKWIVR